ncbi:hypothetical protein [Streptomyces mesophilus]|uniref:hypothetical protein n=1 Tax=Streptomyces mesophilus TaxID=1775132 RepID=UPI002E2A4B5F|nr:hypothetical protein [Streptomyces mesophilus]
MEPAAPPMPEFRPATDESPPTPPQAQPPEVPDAPARPKRRRGRTTALIFAAALLGVAGGTAVGYTVQAERKPTPLPALSQQDLAYPEKSSATAKDAGGRHKADGDLRKLLLPRPSGYRDASFATFEGGTLSDDGWMTVRSYIREFEEPPRMLEHLNSIGVRRIAAADWERGSRFVAIRLVQFGKDGVAGAVENAADRMYYLETDGTDRGEFRGSVDGRWAQMPVEREAGYLPVYHAQAAAFRGDVMVEVHIFDTKPVSKKDIRSFAERQVGRL